MQRLLRFARNDSRGALARSRPLALVFAASLLTACATTAGPGGWSDTPPTTWIERGGDYSLDLPPGWVFRHARSEEQGNPMVATRDGPMLQRIVVTRRRNDKAFPATERRASPDMLAQELAERYVAEIASNFQQDVVDVLVNEPATLAGVDGFRVHLQFRVGELRYQMIAHGVSTAKGFFTMSYAAPLLHYFDRDRETFEQSVTSFRFLGAGAGAKAQ